MDSWAAIFAPAGASDINRVLNAELRKDHSQPRGGVVKAISAMPDSRRVRAA